ncbi:MAG: oligoendopeptidase F [Chloroflexota bacterium]
MTEAPRTRQDVPREDRWNVEALYAEDALWEADFAAAKALPEQVAAYQGRLGTSAATLAEALVAYFQANRALEKVYVYAHLRSDEDLGNGTYQSMMERARSLYVQLGTASAYLAPEILALDAALVMDWMQDEALRPYRFWLEDLLRSKPHVLSPAEERLMAMVGEPLAAISRAYSILTNVDLAARLPKIVGEEGDEQQLTHGMFTKFLESRDRAVRQRAFQGYYGEFKGNRQTIATVLDGAVKTHIFRARARNYPTALEASLFDDKVDVAVYDALIAAVHEALPAFYRYVALRKRLLGVDALHLHDVYVSVVPAVDLHYTYDEAVDLVCAALAPLGDDYVRVMREGLIGGWVDRFENVGKRSGAYSSGCYDSMPYILMNYNGTLDSVFTLAHELGHSMHSWNSKHAQPYHLADYRILVAEVASTTNEALLNDYLLRHTDDRATRAYLTDRYLDSLRGTLYRQTMFAEFEKLIHAHVEGGEPLTVDWLDGQYYGLVKQYLGDSIAFNDEDGPIAWEWARIPHFFYNYYVYKYATGISAATAIARDILTRGGDALEPYLAFLKSGGSDYPLELLKRAGVDLTQPTPVRAALAEFERLVGELETLMA